MKGALIKGVEGQVYPPERQNEIMDILEEIDDDLDDIERAIFGEFPNPPGDFEKRVWKESEWSFRADAVYIEIARRMLEAGKPFDLLALYIGSTDVVAHRFWRYAFPSEYDHPPSKEQVENYGHVIEDEYKYLDKSIGELIHLAPDDATVIIVSDHGMHEINTDARFEADDPPGLRASGHHLDSPPGVFIAAGSHIRSNPNAIKKPLIENLPKVGGVIDITPTILALLGVPVGRDMYGVPLHDVIESSWLEESPIEFVATHDTREWLAARRARIKSAVDEDERIEQLRSLGYIK